MVEPRYVNGRYVEDLPNLLTLGVQEHPYDHLAETRIAIKVSNGDEFPARLREAVDEPGRDGESVVQDFLRDNTPEAIVLRHFLDESTTDSNEKEPHKRYAIELHPSYTMGIRNDFSTITRYLPDEVLD